MQRASESFYENNIVRTDPKVSRERRSYSRSWRYRLMICESFNITARCSWTFSNVWASRASRSCQVKPEMTTADLVNFEVKFEPQGESGGGYTVQIRTIHTYSVKFRRFHGFLVNFCNSKWDLWASSVAIVFLRSNLMKTEKRTVKNKPENVLSYYDEDNSRNENSVSRETARADLDACKFP